MLESVLLLLPMALLLRPRRIRPWPLNPHLGVSGNLTRPLSSQPRSADATPVLIRFCAAQLLKATRQIRYGRARGQDAFEKDILHLEREKKREMIVEEEVVVVVVPVRRRRRDGIWWTMFPSNFAFCHRPRLTEERLDPSLARISPSHCPLLPRAHVWQYCR